MSKVVQVDAGRMAVEGDMLVTNALTLRSQGEALLATLTSPVTVDLAAVELVGNVSLSVLLCWMRKAESLGKKLVILNVPAKMRDMSRVSGLEGLLDRK